MLIEFKRPDCKTVLQDPSDFVGKTRKFPQCNKEVIVPKKQKRPPENEKVIKKRL
jgi:hypothetical protein